MALHGATISSLTSVEDSKSITITQSHASVKNRLVVILEERGGVIYRKPLLRNCGGKRSFEDELDELGEGENYPDGEDDPDGTTLKIWKSERKKRYVY